MRFGANIKFWNKLKEKGWNFSQLSVRLKMNGVDLTPQTLFQYADGRRVPNKAEQKEIARVFGCTIKEIF